MVNPLAFRRLRGRSNNRLVMRGMSQGMRAWTVTFSGGTARSRCFRSVHYSPVPFRFAQFAIPVFSCTGSNPIIDTLFSGSQAQLFFQLGFEYPFTQALSGLLPRIPITFRSANFVAYNNATFDGSVIGHILSDIVDLGQLIPAFAKFGLWTTVELPAGVWNNNLPSQRNASNFIQRFCGSISSTSSQIVAQGGATNVALDATSITAATSLQAGASTMFTPCMMRIGVDPTLKFVTAIGDSLTYGVGEGTDTTDLTADSLGDSFTNAGHVDRGLFETLQTPLFNLGVGSDGNKFLATAVNWKYRRALLQLANPTHILNFNGHNDISASGITINAKVNGNAYTRFVDVVLGGTGLYMCIQTGTSSTVSLTGQTGQAIVDGGVTWAYIGPLPATSNPRGWGVCFAQRCNVNEQIKTAVPGIPIIGGSVTPDTASSDSWASNAQTPNTGWGDATSRAQLYNAKVQTLDPLCGETGFFNIDTYAAQQGESNLLWAYSPSLYPKWMTSDGTHPNSHGADRIAGGYSKSVILP